MLTLYSDSASSVFVAKLIPVLAVFGCASCSSVHGTLPSRHFDNRVIQKDVALLSVGHPGGVHFIDGGKPTKRHLPQAITFQTAPLYQVSPDDAQKGTEPAIKASPIEDTSLQNDTLTLEAALPAKVKKGKDSSAPLPDLNDSMLESLDHATLNADGAQNNDADNKSINTPLDEEALTKDAKGEGKKSSPDKGELDDTDDVDQLPVMAHECHSPGYCYDPVESVHFIRDTYKINGINLGATTPDELYNYCKLVKSTFSSGEPKPGDIVFFHNTEDLNGDGERNDWFSHAAIVTDVKKDGEVVFIGWEKNGLMSRHLNLSKPTKSPKRSHSSQMRGEGKNGRLSKTDFADQLFAGYCGLLKDKAHFDLIENWTPQSNESTQKLSVSSANEKSKN